MTNNDYAEFIARKQETSKGAGFDPLWIPDFLFDFQRHLVEWAVRKGRSAIFADCGLGKTPMQLVWAENIVRKTNKPVLIITPLAVSQQTEREAEKFGIDATASRDGSVNRNITITNYERLHYFSTDDFGGVVCDESSAIKNFTSKRRFDITNFMKRVPYRLLCTATAAPNDFHELGTSSEALGYLGYRDMITRFFKQETVKDYLGWGRSKFRFRGHAELPFWRWVCSWARAVRKPSDIGFDDSRFVLPKLSENEILVKNTRPRDGQLFSTPAISLREQREERRNTLEERCGEIADRVNGKPTVIWCHLNPEGDLLEKLIPDAVQVSGSMSDNRKENRLMAFTSGDIRVLVTKPKIGCWGLNWQHCSDVFMFPSHSFEQYYQAVRRCWRFGQQSDVNVGIVTTEGETRVMSNLRRKAGQADKMFSRIVAGMSDALSIESDERFAETERVPTWL